MTAVLTRSRPYIVSGAFHIALLAIFSFFVEQRVPINTSTEIEYVQLNFSPGTTKRSLSQTMVPPAKMSEASRNQTRTVATDVAVTTPRESQASPSSSQQDIGDTPSSSTGGSTASAEGARGVGTASFSQVSNQDSYVQTLLNELLRRQVYPDLAKRMRQQGRVKMRIRVERTGKVVGIEVLEKSQYEELNRAAQKLVESIGSFKPFPEHIRDHVWAFTIPIEYIL